MIRGTVEGADCAMCPFSASGLPNKPVHSESADDPMWLIIGEGPGHTEVRQQKPFCGPSGMVVDKVLVKIGRPRDQLYIGNATLCLPPFGSPVEDREKAAECCSGRLKRELALYPGKPILTLGAVAARAVIPKADLDAIDPPDVPKSKKKIAKEKQRAEHKDGKKRAKAIETITARRFNAALKHLKTQIVNECRRKYQRKPDASYLQREIGRVRGQIRMKCNRDAVVEYEAKLKEQALAKQNRDADKAKKPKKRKPIKITDIMGSTFEVDVDGTGKRVVIPAIHPAALLRGGGATIGGTHAPDLAYINLTYDARKTDQLANGKDIWLRFDKIDTEIEDPDRTAQLFADIVWEAIDEGLVGIDLETYVDDPERHHALMAYEAKIRALGLSTKKRAISVLWDLLPSWAPAMLQMLLSRVTVIAHNGLYDRTVLRNKHYGFILNEIWHDTLLGHAAAFPGVAHRLQSVTSQLFAVEPWKAEYRNAEETLDKLTLYNAKDTFSTVADHEPLQIIIRRSDTERSYKRDQKMSEIASRMHLVGMPVSREVNTELVGRFQKISQENRRSVEEKLDDPNTRKLVYHHLAIQQASKKRKADSVDFEDRYQLRLSVLEQAKFRWKISSSKHIAALLLALGVSMSVKTEGGEISTKKEILESLVNVGVVRDILAFREADKALNTFFWPTFDREVNGEIVKYGFADKFDRVHPIWSLPKISGRWSSWDPVVSNPLKDIWKKGPDGKKFLQRPSSKRQFIAKKGRKFVGFDYSQLEARIIALISGDPFLLKIFSTGQDIHTECARVIFNGVGGSPHYDALAEPGKKRSDAQDALRNVTKNVEYGGFYGGSDETLWKTIIRAGFNVKLADVVMAVRKLQANMPGVVRWQLDTIRRASMPPYELRDFVDKRKRNWPMGQVDANEALNIVPQMTAAAIMDTGMERMDDLILKYRECYPIVQVHDAAVYECWEDDAEAVKADMDRAFPQEYESNGVVIPFPIESKIADCWKDC